MPRIAAIVPVYNRRTLVLDGLESIAAQTRPPAKLVVVDDGSDDGTPDKIEAWMEERDLPFAAKLLRAPRRANPSLARNDGAVDAGDVDVLAFLDSDDLWPADYLGRVAAAFRDHPGVAATCADMQVTDYAVGRTRVHDFRDVGVRATEFFVRHGPIGVSNTAIGARLFHEAGGFDPDQAGVEDYPLELRLSLLGKWVHLPGEPVRFRLRAGEKHGEHNSVAFSNRRPRRSKARNLEQFLREEGGRAAVAERVWRPALARCWFKAGQEALQCGEHDESRASFARAIELLPWHPRYRYWSLWGRIRGLRSRT
ncbi:MAG: glycosyltransferase family 2 protein [Planctomycetota bacterium]|jgi:glycosyltransferase involved in cell wall biosynthesis